MAKEQVTIDLETLRGTCERAVANAGFAPEDAAQIVDVLLYAEMRGNNQGLTKIAEGVVVPDPAAGDIQTVSEVGGVVQIDAARKNGMLILTKAADRAAALAGWHGISAVGVGNSSGSSGAIGYYVRRIAAENKIGILMCGTPKAVAPAGAVDPVFGTNPIAFAAPRPAGEPIVFDMSTGSIAWFGLIAARDRGEEIAPGLAYDSQGSPTTDPAAALGGAIRAVAGHKGSGLALMIELLTGAMAGGGLPGDVDAGTNKGNLLIALDPEAFGATDFGARLEKIAAVVSAAQSETPKEPVLLPGERGDRQAAACLARGNIDIDRRIWTAIQERANAT